MTTVGVNLEPAARVAAALRLPAWLARLRLRATEREIGRLERALADEFGLLETAPLHDHLGTLRTDRDRLLRRLSGAD